MVIELPSYEFIQAVAKAGIIRPLDCPWVDISIVTNSQAFCKFNCDCPKNALNKSKWDESIEIILRPYSASENRKKLVYYIGQCKRCKKIYWVENNS